MGKLVLFLKDASPVEIPLAKERVTIGRRADNDVCLPSPAVSGEHAAVVTILADSFLEDLGSTNGTLVNGRPIAKHFLRDRDQIDIGRQLLVYLADADARAEPPPALAAREDRRDLGKRVEAAKPRERVEPTLSAIDRELSADVEPEAAPAAPERLPDPEPPPAPRTRIPTAATADDATFDAELAQMRREAPARAVPPAAPRPPPVPEVDAPPRPRAPPVRGRLHVLTGPSAGRVVDIASDPFVVGRVGAQVAAIETRDEALWLVPREGDAAPSVNGEPVPAGGREIRPGDTLEIAGTRLELAPEG
jgi:hypothetical protein